MGRDDNEQRWKRIRDDRWEVQEYGKKRCWAGSPSHHDIEEAFELAEQRERTLEKEVRKGEQMRMETLKTKKKEDKARRKAALASGADPGGSSSDSDSSSDSSASSSSRSSTDSDRKKRKKSKKKKDKKEKSKKHDKSKKSKKKKKSRRKEKSESEEEAEEDEWEEATVDTAASTANVIRSDEIGPMIPPHLLAASRANVVEPTRYVNYGSDMLKGEAEQFAAYLAAGKRIPRRGEIGLSSDEIADYERAGYVMSGSRHKAMEATRLRKENQVLTVEEKRMLKGFSQEERKKKDDVVLGQFRALIQSKQREFQ